MNKKVCVSTLGCPKNIVDSEKLLATLNYEYEITENPNQTDYLIINTCGFLQSSVAENEDYISQAIKLKQIGKIEKIFVVGCLVSRNRAELTKKFPDIDGFFGTDFLDKLPAKIKQNHNELYGERKLLTPSHYAYLKISDGCEHNCAFCAIPAIKGKFNSLSIEKLVEEAKYLAALGVKELILIAQDTTSYGIDLYKEQKLNELLQELSRIEQFKWIRLMYTYPRKFPTNILNTIKTADNIAKYIDMPIQHISTNILRKMGRGMSKEETINLLRAIRQNVPNIAIRTTFIVGFPGETEKEFAELRDFIEEFEFDRMGVFEYSAEIGTAAYKYSDTVSKDIKAQRLEELMLLQQNISLKKNRKLIGNEMQTLIDEVKDAFAIGRTQYDAPEIDQQVIIKSKKLIAGGFYNVKIVDAREYDLIGKVVK